MVIDVPIITVFSRAVNFLLDRRAEDAYNNKSIYERSVPPVKKWILYLLPLCLLMYLSVSAATDSGCGENAQWTLRDGVLTVSGSGAMTDYESVDEVPWYPQRSSIDEVVISEGITTVGDMAFAHCAGLRRVTLPQTLLEIGDNAFWGCVLLEQAELPEGLTHLGAGAFCRCVRMDHIRLPQGITALNEGVFAQCEALDTVELHDGVTVIGENAFSRCYSLRHIALPGGLEEMGRHAFFGCPRLSEITFPEGFRVLGEASFYGCAGLTTLRFMGQAPELDDLGFLDITATVYHSIQDHTWDTAAGREFGGRITWVAECFHEYRQEHTAPTCETEGYTTFICGLCGDRYQDLFIPALGHDWGEWEVVREATPEEPGQRRRRCERCFKEETEDIPVLDILYGDANTDGKVNTLDVILLRQYLAGWDVTLGPKA